MNYKRKAHRGRGKKNTMDNQACRFAGNSASVQMYMGGRKGATHQSATQRNRVSPDEVE